MKLLTAYRIVTVLGWVYWVTSMLWAGLILYMAIRGITSPTRVIAVALGVAVWLFGLYHYRCLAQALLRAGLV